MCISSSVDGMSNPVILDSSWDSDQFSTDEDVVIKKTSNSSSTEGCLMLQCDPSVADSAQLENIPPLYRKGKNTLEFLFGSVWMACQPYIYESCGNRECPDRLETEEDADTLKPGVLDSARNFFILWRSEIKNGLYVFLVIASVISTYQLDKVEVSQEIKDAFQKRIGSFLERGYNFIFGPNNGFVLGRADISSYLKETRDLIDSGSLIIHPGLIDVEKVEEMSSAVKEAVAELGSRGSELPVYVERLADFLLDKIKFPDKEIYSPIRKLSYFHFISYSYEEMVSLLKTTKIKSMEKDHAVETFRLFRTEIEKIVKGARKFFNEERVLDFSTVNLFSPNSQ